MRTFEVYFKIEKCFYEIILQCYWLCEGMKKLSGRACMCWPKLIYYFLLNTGSVLMRDDVTIFKVDWVNVFSCCNCCLVQMINMWINCCCVNSMLLDGLCGKREFICILEESILLQLIYCQHKLGLLYSHHRQGSEPAGSFSIKSEKQKL